MDSSWGTPQPGVVRGIGVLSQGVDELLDSPTSVLSETELRAALVDLGRVRARAEAAHLALVRGLLAHDSGTRPGARTAQALQGDLRMDRSRANADVQNAKLTDPETGVGAPPACGGLRELGAALGEGSVSREHVDVARRAVRRPPRKVMRQQRDLVAGSLTEHALEWSPGASETLARYLVSVAAPELSDKFDPDDLDRRYWSHTTDDSGGTPASSASRGRMIVGRFQLPPSARELIEQVDYLASPHRDLPGPDDDEATEVLPGTADTRTPAQRRADAVVQIGRRSAAAGRCGICLANGINPVTPTVVVHTTAEQMSWVPGAGCNHHHTENTDGTDQTGGAGADDADTGWGTAGSGEAAGATAAGPGAARCDRSGPLSAATLQRLACDAVIERVIITDGVAAKLETLGRLATDKQRLLLAARDGGCTFPRCDAPASICDAHHITWWSRGGKTVITNLALLCQAHHDTIHAGQWTMTITGGQPWFIPPRWIDPNQRPIATPCTTPSTKPSRPDNNYASTSAKT